MNVFERGYTRLGAESQGACCSAANPCIRKAHCRPTIAPFTGCMSPIVRNTVSGSQTDSCNQISGCQTRSTITTAGINMCPTIIMVK